MGRFVFTYKNFITATCFIALLIIFTKSANAQNHTLHSNLQYAQVGNVQLRLDLYVPNSGGPFPLIIWIHGGGWTGGDKTLNPNSTQVRQVGRGYALASINYRLSQQAKFPAQIYDCKAAVRWLRANAAQYNLDVNRFGVWGSSAGGHLVALLATSSAVNALEDYSMGNANQTSKVQAVIDWYGPTDFLQMEAHDLPCGGICHDCPTSPESQLIGCTITTCRPRVSRANPAKYVYSGITYPPFLIMHGTADCSVPPNQSQILYDALNGVGATVTLNYLEGAGHGGPEFTSAASLALIDNFFDTKLRGLTLNK
jgi:acetyl esterase/lipase